MNKVGFFRSIQLKFIIIFILLLLLAMQIIGSFFTEKLEENLRNNFNDTIDQNVQLLSYNLEQAFNKDREDEEVPSLPSEVQDILDDFRSSNITNIEVIDNQSRVIAASGNRQSNIGDKTTREIVQQAILFDTFDERTMRDQDNNQVFVKADPVFNDEGILEGVIYLEASYDEVNDQLQDINKIFLQGSILAIVTSALIGILVARSITRPIIEMREQARTMSKGDFSQKVNVYGKDEISQLAETFNDLNSRLKHSYATIEEERWKLSSVLFNMSDGVIATDNGGVVTLMNESAGRLMGQNPDDIIGDFLLDVLQLEEKVVDLTELLESGTMIIDFSNDEQDFLIRANFSTVLDDEDEVTGFITVISDVTEQEKVEQERREFVSNVSHELRTPLTTMKSYVEALTEGAWQDKEIAPKFLGVAQNETERMIRMVNDLLQLSKMDVKEYPLNRERTEFVNYFHQIIDRFDMNLPEQISLRRELPKGQYYVWLDKDKMTQVLDNIISNAIKYSPEGGEIRLKVENKRYHLLVSIQDPGLGIAYDKLEKIFERFYRADKARTRKLGGTGLGLAISKELIEAHHGQVWAKSKEGKGTTVFFTLPLMNQKRRGI
ncbi:cell wall metabolism sensor histidine kinase WalK [Virgibacillus profundi]|uniref:histidine kinase n=1 Tax=Virgibacillus profundi TaxID=2024555 RepID=A0A2A2IBE2_9BACI|nr:cell wall metabolism sensor histidine kinase WalK [Virgibacillus profundi]PAV28465.1 cell wall metabolism sensor histidine kinase WalK [Virgibacillus profundi]PXY52638.1 cell wall metabolism sensor histidine kinase WalK [Virgibacillus profundi]